MLIPDDLETPCAVVDLDRLDRNLSTMAAEAAAAGVALRPHAKTHKCLEIAARQLALGAAGLTVATLTEAETFAAAGCHSIFIAYPFWAGSAGRAERLKGLSSRVDLRVGVDSITAAEALAAAAPGIRVLIEIDSGQHRSGVLPSEVGDLAIACLSLGLELAGAFTHPGHAYGSADTVRGASAPGEVMTVLADGVAAALADERLALSAAGAVLAGTGSGGRGGRPLELSGGSSPTAAAGLSGPLTEVRPGTYVFGDRQQMYLSGLALDDVALVVAARVVSVPRPGEAVLDAGSKALSADRAAWMTGHGLILEAPEATIVSLNEEHAVVRGITDSVLAVGDLVRVVPNHVCSVVNLFSSLAVVRDGALTDAWPVVARRLHLQTPCSPGERAPRSADPPQCPSAPACPRIWPPVFRDIDRRAQPAVSQWLVVEPWNDMQMGMEAIVVPAEQVGVWGQQIVQRHLCPEQQIPNVCPLRGGQLEDRSPVDDGHDRPGAGQDAVRQLGSGTDDRVP